MQHALMMNHFLIHALLHLVVLIVALKKIDCLEIYIVKKSPRAYMLAVLHVSRVV